MNVSYSELRRNTLPDPPEVSRHDPQTIHQAGGDKAPTTPKRSLHILCIDDDEQILEMMKDCLTHYEHRVRVASGGKYGIELFRTAMLKSEPYEVVITDLGMPDVDGYHVAGAIKAESPQHAHHHDDRKGRDDKGRRENGFGSGRCGWQTAAHRGTE